MNKRGIFAALVMFLLVACLPVGAQAATYKWVSVGNGDMRCYKNGTTLVKNKWVQNRHLNAQGYMDRSKWVTKKIYVNSKGYRITGLQRFSDGYRYFSAKGKLQTGWKKIKNNNYYFVPKTGLALTNGIYKFNSGKSYYFDKEGKLITGWADKSNKTYYFGPYMFTGWHTISGNRYYFNTATGERAEGIYGIDGKLYYFDPVSGIQQTSVSLGKTTVSYGGRSYTISESGECNLVPGTNLPSSDMLFFQVYESGSERYNQTGGDNGCACGAYQFDYRYALLPFVKFAYSQNAKLCAEFKQYVSWTSGAKLKSNQKFYKAWHKIFARDALAFSQLQDLYAKQEYYDTVENSLAKSGINLATRPDVVKGAVFSYSIQHGQTSAVNAVKACKITSATTDKQFLKKLYNYRIKQYPAYSTRYTSEKNLALSKL